MSNQKKEKVIHVENLVIHAKKVEIIREHEEQPDRDYPRRDPWDFFWGRRTVEDSNERNEEEVSGH